jgi:hypothetical protein
MSRDKEVGKIGTIGSLHILHRTILSNSEINPLSQVQLDYLEILGWGAGMIADSIMTGVDD